MVQRTLLWLGLIVAMIAAATLFERHYPQSPYNHLTTRLLHPLDTRVRYRIGTIDPRFGLTSAQVERLALEAAELWERDTGAQLFVYDDNARLSINLVYDERQENMLAVARFGDSLAEMVAAQKTAAQALHARRSELEQFADSLAHELAFASTLDSDERKRLQVAIEQFNARQASYNADVASHNAQEAHIAELVAEANAQFATGSFHQGEFDGRTINVYTFASTDELRLVLAHEFGHALGLLHTDVPEALMYPMASKEQLKNFRLHPADIALFKAHRQSI